MAHGARVLHEHQEGAIMTRKDYVTIANALRTVRAAAANAYPPPCDDTERERDAQRAAVHGATKHAPDAHSG
jgi:hypothetical protein